MKEITTYGIFPTPINLSEIDRKLTKKEIQFFKNIKSSVRENIGNTRSINDYILDEPEMCNIKKELMSSVQKYVDNILSYKSKNSLYITQSWLNYTEAGQHHHLHTHSNSIISGVFYIDVDEINDGITFEKSEYEQIQVEVNEWNAFNSSRWIFKVKTGQLILFPSKMQHKVDIKKEKNVRISLAFNTFIKGSIGYKNNLTELKM